MSTHSLPYDTVRTALLESLLDGVANSRAGECLAVIGGPSTGRTTVLHTLKKRLGRRAILLQYRGADNARDQSDLAAEFASDVSKAIESGGDSSDTTEPVWPLPTKRVVILIDDFDKYLAFLSVGHLQWLREKCSHPDVSLVITLREYLSRIARSVADASRFDSIFAASRHCEPLSREESLRLLQQEWLQKEQVPLEVVDWVRGVAGPHPWFLSSIMKRARKRRERNGAFDEAWFRETHRDLPGDWGAKCESLWSALAADEQRVAQCIAETGKVSEAAREAALTLIRMRCVAFGDRDIRLINEVFSSFVRDRIKQVSWYREPTSYRSAREAIGSTFTEAERDPDPLYYLTRAMECIAEPPHCEEGNAMLRSAMEAFLIIASRRCGASYDGLTGEGGVRAVIRLIAQRCDCEETFEPLWMALVSHLNKQGAHPGIPAVADDTRLRLDTVAGIMVLVANSLRATKRE